MHISIGDFVFQLIEMYDRAVDDYNKALELNPEAAIASRLRTEIAQISVDGSGDGGIDDPKEIECRQILPMGVKYNKESLQNKGGLGYVRSY